MIASLPMYLRPENRAAHDSYYALIRDALRDHGQDAPDALTHDAPIWDTWGRPDLTLGQICNLPYRMEFSGKVTLIGAADHDLPNTPSGSYYSVLITRKNDDPDPCSYGTRTLAFNEPASHSGWTAAQIWAAQNDICWTKTLQTGGHHASAQAVAQGRADIAAIDAQTWRNITRWAPFADSLCVVARTGTSPGLSYITAANRDPAPYFAAIGQAIAALTAETRQILDIKAIVALPETDYLDLPLPHPPQGDPTET